MVKKFDNGAAVQGDEPLTLMLIPELYAAPFMAYLTLESHINMLRDSLVVKDEEEETDYEDSAMDSIRMKALLFTKDSANVRRRAEEMAWLHVLLDDIPGNKIPRLVAHRGEYKLLAYHML